VETKDLENQNLSAAVHFETCLLDQLQISKLSDDEAAEVTDLIRHNMAPFQEAGRVLAAIWLRLKDLYGTYEAEGASYLVAKLEESGEIIGGIGIGPFAGLSFNERKGAIRDLFVSPEYRGRNVGKRLFHEAMLAAKRFGYESVYLETTPEMVHAQNLFRRFGFRPIEHGNKEKANSEELACYFLLENLT